MNWWHKDTYAKPSAKVHFYIFIHPDYQKLWARGICLKIKLALPKKYKGLVLDLGCAKEQE